MSRDKTRGGGNPRHFSAVSLEGRQEQRDKGLQGFSRQGASPHFLRVQEKRPGRGLKKRE